MIKENQRTLNQINGLTDVLMLFPSMVLAYILRFYVFQGQPGHIGLSYYLWAVVILAPFVWLLYGLMGLYESFRSKNFLTEFSLLLRSNTILFLLILAFFFIYKEFHLSRWTLLAFFLIATCGITLKRWLLRRLLRTFRERGYNLKHVLLVGCGEQARGYLAALQQNPALGYCLAGYLAPRDTLSGVRYLGSYAALSHTLVRVRPDEVVIALEAAEYDYLAPVIAACEKDGVKVSLIPFYNKYLPARPQIDEIGSVSLVNLRRIPLDNIGNAFVKRVVDIVGSLCLIVLSAPLMLFAAIGVKLSSPGPILFKQERVGLHKQPFYMYKFRSMRVNDTQSTGWSTNADPRKTKFGAFIRKFSIDELPQFFNVLRGEMSLVGPRPELPFFVEQFKESVPLYMVKHQVRPGITGWAQVNGFRGDTSIKGRIEHDIYYIENWSLLFDIKILFLTLSRGLINSEKLG
ncbi:MAG: undecaprenyl-phosphate glucose phosphotransferase [Agathobaculum sp.]|uniref:undecaprenyl-phosphate glucose phosphotransferase n=1 Tax=Agathobaculum sp. TaxID=2048138 RepID=UPI0025BCDFA7|nr:undecaprenyl-phosphate glucose phosphotransferase [Agathobaculum sp.]MCI7124871.1 undecaprenyl-phosphate glucose phosphotransferase [Agathobaculum sp.]